MTKSYKEKNKHLIKLYEQGVQRVDRMLDIVTIINELKNIKILMENTVLNDEVKDSIKHSKDNLIILDEDDLKFDSSSSKSEGVDFDSISEVRSQNGFES